VAEAVRSALTEQLTPVVDSLRAVSARLDAADPDVLAERVARSIQIALAPLRDQLRNASQPAGPPPLAHAAMPRALEVVARELPPAMSGSVEDSVVAAVTKALTEVHMAAVELHGELVRLRAFRAALEADMPTVAAAVDAADERASQRLVKAADQVNGLRSYVNGAAADFPAFPAAAPQPNA
jgi:hypothetical protein